MVEIEDYENDCESIFAEDVAEKKKTGRGMYGKTAFTRNRNGGMPSDMLKGKELRKYMGNSEVTTYNLNDIKKIVPGKFGKKTTAEGDACICKMYVDGEKISTITKKYGISAPVVYAILKKSGIPKRAKKEKGTDEILPETTADIEPAPIELCEPCEDLCETSVDYKYEFEQMAKKYALLKEENDKYKFALLNLAMRMV